MSDTDTVTHRRIPPLAVALAGVVVVVLAIGAFAVSRPDGSSGGGPWAAEPEGWTALPSPPDWHVGAAFVWTGDQLLYWGGRLSDGGDSPSADGFAFDPVTSTWTALPAAPIGGDVAAGMWTGSEALFFLPGSDGVRTLAFDPASNTWRTFEHGPRGPNVTSSWTWIGRFAFVFGGTSRKHATALTWTFDPWSGVWVRQSNGPLPMSAPTAVVSGPDLIIVGNSGDLLHPGATTLQAEAFLLPRPSWRVLPDTRIPPIATSMATVGDRTVLWQATGGSSLEWLSDKGDWRSLDMPDTNTACYADGAAALGLAFGWNCGAPVVWSASTSVWSEVDPPQSVNPSFISFGRTVGVTDGFVVEDQEQHDSSGSGAGPYTQRYLWFWKPPTS